MTKHLYALSTGNSRRLWSDTESLHTVFESRLAIGISAILAYYSDINVRNVFMTGKELIKRLRKFSRQRDLDMHLEEKRGKGSHITIYLGERFAVIPDLKKELKTGTLKAILKQLDVNKDDL